MRTEQLIESVVMLLQLVMTVKMVVVLEEPTTASITAATLTQPTWIYRCPLAVS